MDEARNHGRKIMKDLENALGRSYICWSVADHDRELLDRAKKDQLTHSERILKKSIPKWEARAIKADEDAERILDQVDLLPKNESKVLRLVYLDGLKLKEAASIMGYSECYVGELHLKALDLIGAKFSPRIVESQGVAH